MSIDGAMLQEAVEAAKVAARESSAARESMGKALVERNEFFKWMRRVLLITVLLLVLVIVVLAVMLPLATRNSRNLAISAEQLRIIKQVTGPEQAKAGQARLGLAICELKNENATLHGHPEGAPDCSPADLKRLAEAAVPSSP